MTKPEHASVQLPFSQKYDGEHSNAYFHKHQDGVSRQLSTWRDLQIARKALRIADDPTLVLDLPCGAGRFWTMLAEHPHRVIIGADYSADMLEVAQNAHLPLQSRIRTLQTSAFEIDLPDNAVDCIFCMRLMHHVGESAHRMTMLKEFHRVSRDTVIISLWVDGNYKAWKRRRLDQKRSSQREERDFQNRFVLPVKQVEREFSEAGFSILTHLDFLPFYAMWRTYVLRKKAP